MSALTWEVRNMQNPALGAALLWRFAYGFKSAHHVAEHVPFHLLFIALPILLHEPTYELVKSTHRASGLHVFVAKFSRPSDARQDLLVGLHGRVGALKELTLESFRVAQSSKLLLMNTTGRIICLTETASSVGDDPTKLLMSNAEKLGGWCASLTVLEVAIALKVRF